MGHHESKICVGIDPGRSGALAIVQVVPATEYRDREIQWAEVADIPYQQRKRRLIQGELKVDFYVDVGQCVAILRGWCSAWGRTSIPLAVLEEPIAVKHAGRAETSAAIVKRTHQNYGRLQVVAEKVCEDWVGVLPASWKREMQATKDKDESRRMAAAIFPDLKVMLGRKKDDGRAEALLIALYGCEHLLL